MIFRNQILSRSFSTSKEISKNVAKFGVVKKEDGQLSNQIKSQSDKNKQYGSSEEKVYDVLSVFDRGAVAQHGQQSTVQKVENFVESLFFKFEEGGSKEDD